MNKMILMLSFGYGGAESRVLKVANEVLDSESDKICINQEFIDVAGGRSDLHLVLDALKKNESLITLPKVPYLINKVALFRYLWVLLASSIVLFKNKPKIFHGVLGGILVSFVAKIFGSKVVVELTSPDNVDFVNRFKYVVATTTDIFLCVSESVKKRAEYKIGKGVFLVYPVPFYQLRSQDYKRKNDKKVIISFCARFIPRKNALLFAKAVNELLKEKDDVLVNVLGGGEQEAEIKKILKEYIKKKIVFVGRVSNPYEILQESDVFVSLIEPDNYPSQSVLEAMNAKNALLLSDTGLSSRFIKGNGYLTSLEIDDIKKHLSMLVNNRTKIKTMGEASLNKLKNEFSKDVFIEYLMSIYKDELNK